MRRMGGSWPDPGEPGRRHRSSGLAVGAAIFLAIGIVIGAAFVRSSAPAAGRTRAPVTAGVPGVGPHEVAQGVPVGYERSALGAAQAAGNYLATLGALVDPARLSAALDRISEPTSRDRLERALAASLHAEEGLWGIQAAVQQGQPVLLAQTPIAFKVDQYTPDEATVRVWLMTAVGIANRQRLASMFGIATATLAWVESDWRLRTTDAGSQATDVVPACLQTPTPTGGVPSQLDGFVPYGR